MKKADLLISVTSMLHVMTKAKMYAVGLLIMLNAVAVSFTQMVTARV